LLVLANTDGRQPLIRAVDIVRKQVVRDAKCHVLEFRFIHQTERLQDSSAAEAPGGFRLILVSETQRIVDALSKLTPLQLNQVLNINRTVDELGQLLECVVSLKLFALVETAVLMPLVLSARHDEPIRHLNEKRRRQIITYDLLILFHERSHTELKC
jgi:hypothetical protein